jgi:hypothetical protein
MGGQHSQAGIAEVQLKQINKKRKVCYSISIAGAFIQYRDFYFDSYCSFSVLY